LTSAHGSNSGDGPAPISPAPINHVAVGVLGLLTICAYGSWYYSFGVLLDPVRSDTGWSESTLAGSFSTGQVLVGVAALLGGRMLDRVGHRPVFILGAIVGPSALLLASFAQSVAVFFVGSALALAAMGSLGFYPATMTTVVRLNPANPSRAISRLTIWGAFASVIFLPLASWLEGQFGWRPTVRILALVTAAAFLLCVVGLPAAESADTERSRSSIASVLASLVSTRTHRLFTIVMAFGGIAMATMLVYQVPVMIAAGLGASTAATMAGVRGFAQLGGRLPLDALVTRFGGDRSLVMAMSAMALGGAILSVAGSVPVAILFAVVAGFGIGAFSPLQGMKADELFDREQLGATMGAYGAVLLVAGSLGPLTAGVIAEQTGERRWAAVIGVVAGVVSVAAAIALSRQPGETAQAQQDRPNHR